DYFHFTYPAVAKLLKIPLGTVKSRLHHARILLKKEYEDK
ncbi:MAG: RNA polymerase sigma factor SigY, partial [Candidatus Cloacimonetes bacterium]|nr:RNA polymerase sigma factor SigY [Candidatus Cloacimonadota bacterium]